VVFHADRELHRAGFTTLRFNFRGVGESEGEHDAGRGEVDDIAAAVAWLRGTAPGLPMFAVGFSFGSVCSIRHALRDRAVQAVIAIGLPVDLYDLDPARALARPFAVVQADQDEFGAPDRVRALLKRTAPEGTLHVVAGTTHLFPGRAPDAARAVVEAANAILASRPGPG
jgi:alpha/beta superfamily hydrolase